MWLNKILNRKSAYERIEELYQSCDSLIYQLNMLKRDYEILQAYSVELENDLFFEKEQNERLEKRIHNIDSLRKENYIKFKELEKKYKELLEEKEG